MLATVIWLALPGFLGAHAGEHGPLGVSASESLTAVSSATGNTGDNSSRSIATSDRTQADGENPNFIVVRQGDTLWAIAKRYAPRGEDLRAWIADAENLNGLDGAMIHPGQKIVLPESD